ncbi:hypothetical protein, partial [Pantoea stewartii]|uniref:hypothetical protein n=1 Tax=Pantoea stewartii TaxID=66269 RepID=UPI0007365443
YWGQVSGKRYPEEFKIEAANLVRQGRGQSVNHLDRDNFTHRLFHRYAVGQNITIFLLAGGRADCAVADKLIVLFVWMQRTQGKNPACNGRDI